MTEKVSKIEISLPFLALLYILVFFYGVIFGFTKWGLILLIINFILLVFIIAYSSIANAPSREKRKEVIFQIIFAIIFGSSLFAGFIGLYTEDYPILSNISTAIILPIVLYIFVKVVIDIFFTHKK